MAAFVGMGIGTGVLRGCIEAWLIVARYPFRPGGDRFIELMIECAVAYGLAVGISGTVLAWLMSRVIRPGHPWRYLLPVAFLVAIVAIDVAGWISAPVSPDLLTGPAPVSDGFAGDNIVLITLDTCRADHLPMYGYPLANTPSLARLALWGSVFRDAVTAIPVTTPSHVTLMTGLDPPVHGSRFNAVPFELPFPTLAGVLSGHGLLTGAFISAFPLMADVSGLQKGFTVYEQLLCPRKLDPLFYRTTLMKPFLKSGPFRPAERPADQAVDAALAWWSSGGNRSRFTWIHLYDPHAPYEPPELYRRMFSDFPNAPDMRVEDILAMNSGPNPPDDLTAKRYIECYDGEIAFADRAIGRLLGEIQRRGEADRTWIIITADHGESLVEHDYFFSHGDHLYDVSLRIPLVFFKRDRIPAGRILTGDVSLADITPTLLNLTGMIDEAHPWNGMDLTGSLLAGGRFPERNIYLETGSGVYIRAHAAPDAGIRRKTRGVRAGPAKYILDPDGRGKLYHLGIDPGENHPIHPAGDAVACRMSADLADYVRRRELPGRHPLHLPSPETVDRLRALGYIDPS